MFFKYCSANLEASENLLYQDAPTQLTFHWSSQTWNQRGMHSAAAVGCVCWVPQQGEEYYLCLLLHQIPSPTSFSCLRKINGVQFAMHKEACEALELLHSDTEYDQYLQEASTFGTAHTFRSLFMVILTQCQPANSLALLHCHTFALSEG